MAPERWQQVKQILAEALDCPPKERPSFLAEACAEDSTLRSEVEALLTSCEEAEACLEPALSDVEGLLSELTEEDEAPLEISQRIGAYRTIRLLGRGGMGAVYLAERADGQFQKEVALKVIKRGIVTDEIIRRFRGERQILAQLEHPGIARLLDGGVTDERFPYFVMEYACGDSITAYCDRQQLSVHERLRLFLQVCEGVAHAHRNLIVHLDLKPSNVLVTEEGRVKLLDFGIATLLEPDAASPSASRARPGLPWLTPEYASPEQVKGTPVTTATDVYALGALLYKLTAGRRPCYFGSRSFAAIKQTICETTPEKPSTAVLHRSRAGDTVSLAAPETISQKRATTPRKLCRTLRGDLDAIALKALQKEPEQRYASAAELKDDIERYLQGRPVAARRDAAKYRAAKFLQRHRWGAAVAAAFLLLLVGYAVTVTVQAERVQTALRGERVEKEKMEETLALLTDLFQIPDPQQIKGELLEQNVQRIEQELEDQPEVRAQMLNLAGQIYQSLGLYGQAHPLLKASLKTRRQLFDQPHPELATGVNDLAGLLRRMGHYEDAEPLFREALTLWDTLLGADLRNVSRREVETGKAESLNDLGLLLKTKGEYANAEQLYREALALWERGTEEDHLERATTLSNLAVLLKDQGRYAAADSLHRQALYMRRTLLGENSLEVAYSFNHLALLMQDQTRYREADSLHRRALAIRERLLGQQHPEVTTSLNNIGLALLNQTDKLDAAEAFFRRALSERRALLGERHPKVATVYYNLGVLMQKKGAYAAADSLYRRSLEIDRAVYGDEHRYVGMGLAKLASLLRTQGKAGEATRLLEEALTIFQNTFPEGHWRTAQAQSELGACLVALKQYERADAVLQEGYVSLKKAGRSTDVKQVLERLVKLYEAWERTDEAAYYSELIP